MQLPLPNLLICTRFLEFPLDSTPSLILSVHVNDVIVKFVIIVIVIYSVNKIKFYEVKICIAFNSENCIVTTGRIEFLKVLKSI